MTRKTAKKTIDMTDLDEAPDTPDVVEGDSNRKIDHLEDRDNQERPDNTAQAEAHAERLAESDLSFWNGAWVWNMPTAVGRQVSDLNRLIEAAEKANDQSKHRALVLDREDLLADEDNWYVAPSETLVGEVAAELDTVYQSCRIALETSRKDLLDIQVKRELDYLREAESMELLNDVFDKTGPFTTRFIQNAQRYLSKIASYNRVVANERSTKTMIDDAKQKQMDAGKQCRLYAAKLLGVEQAYHDIVTDPKAYQVKIDFSGDNTMRVRMALQQQARQMTKSIKNGNMDAEQYRIPLPWKTDMTTKKTTLDANDLLSDMA